MTLETGIGFLLVRHMPCVYSFDVVRGTEVVMRTVLTPTLHIQISEHLVAWVDTTDSNKYWQV